MIQTLRRFAVMLLGACSLLGTASAEDWVFIDNGRLKLGILKDSGGGIAWLSESGSTENVVNHWDRGRLIQQSYYGKQDGSLWNKQPWSWNPVQGGDWRGHSAKLLDFKPGSNSLYAKTLPKHWASGEDLTNTVMEEWISLTGKVAHVHFKFSYAGVETHPARDHEVPALFFNPQYKELVLYNGARPWSNETLSRSVPGWPNESRAITENWAAYVNTNNFGAGAYVPIATNLTCYRFGNGEARRGACSYFAPLTRFAIGPGTAFEYDVYLTIGTVAEIRKRFERIHGEGK